MSTVLSMSMANINHLSDDVLAEILSRLPFRSATQCKCVSKRWLGLISSPSFLGLCISHQHSLFKALFIFLSPHHLMLSFFLNTPPPSLLLLPSPDMLIKGNLCGCSNSFLLCSTERYTTGRCYYIYDPLTKECTHIPPSPATRDGYLYAVGFVSNPDGRFRVVLIESFTRTKNEFKAECFFSEIGEWRLAFVFCHHGFAFAPHGLLGIPFEGRLYFMGSTSIFVCDPFAKNFAMPVINYPQHTNPMNIISFGYLGHSCGSLRIADMGPDDVRVWELKDGDQWHLLHRTILSTNLPAKFCANHFKRVGGFHSYEGDIVYLCSYVDGIFVANLRTNKVEAVPGYEISDMSLFQLELPF